MIGIGGILGVALAGAWTQPADGREVNSFGHS
jgi:hypothetical protein